MIDEHGNDLHDIAAAYGWDCVESMIDNGYYIIPGTDTKVMRGVTDSERLDAIVKRVAALYPQAELTSGYIGNVYSTGLNRDDRSWMVFSKVKDNHGYNMNSPVRVPTNELPTLVEWAETYLEAWVKEKLLPRFFE